MTHGSDKEKYIILLIDDSPLIHKIVKRALGDQYALVSFTNGREAADAVSEIIPDLVLLDVEMPDLDGFATIELLKQHKCMNRIPVIFLTAKTDVDFEFQALQLGAVDYINKPFANPLLLKRIEIHLSHSLQQRYLAHYNEDLQEMVQQKTKIIKELQFAIVYTLADLVEMRDNSTGGHVLRTQAYFKLILDYLAEHNLYQEYLSKVDPLLLLEASQLHDVGKVAIPDSILLKPAALTPDEFEIMKTHTTIGYNAIVKAMELTNDKEFLIFAAEVALTHHEKWNGTGYPKGLSGDEIPLAGRIMAIVDVYDALVSKRHYKNKMTHAEAMKIIQEGKGTHFDPTLIDVVEALGDKFKEISETE